MSGEVVADFLGAMEAAGVVPAEPIAHALASGNPVRFRCEGDRPGRRNGWAVLHLDGRPAGVFRYYKAGLRQTWCADRSAALSNTQRRRLAREIEERRRLKAQARSVQEKRQALKAGWLWQSATPADPAHPYLMRKGIDGVGLRMAGRALLVPMFDADGDLWNVQRIYPDGRKLFDVPRTKPGEGGRTQGLFFLLGAGGDICCLGEGLATMKVVRAATGLPVAVAFSSPQLEPVARLLRKRWPGLRQIICADNDAHLIDHPCVGRNLGLEYAAAAAAAVGGMIATPPPGDFADLAQAAGPEAVRVLIEEAGNGYRG